MARITKAVLEQQVAALEAQLVEMKAQLAAATAREQAALAQAEASRYALDEAMAVVEAQRTPSRRTAAHMPAWQAERAASMALAREMAMRTGRVVKA